MQKPQNCPHISDRLSALAAFYNREAQKCAKGKAFLAASAMQMSAMEAGLQAMCFLYPQQVKKTTVYNNKKFRGKRYKALEFSLKQLIDIAEELAWLPAKRIIWAGKKASIAGFLQEVRDLRNFIHSGKWAREHPGAMTFNKAVYCVVCEVFDVANSWLLHHLRESIEKGMKRKRVSQ